MTPEQHREQAEILLENLWPDGDAFLRTPEQRAEMLHKAQIHATIYAADTQRLLVGRVDKSLALAQAEMAQAESAPEQTS
ncbi:hypothetical protein [Micromonospora robiginosa]|uniref:Uncharacterized protein n=1 Tax=Micromonospora robiginosa TaxID=2749844 RepID=A0A7L6B7L6_9ACTN|nr:hypothetical protein [Micromonospora ferruginea]QLQ37966.1 hypothetical protein H1D33_03470 [Micromonospora ferruginea]